MKCRIEFAELNKLIRFGLFAAKSSNLFHKLSDFITIKAAIAISQIFYVSLIPEIKLNLQIENFLKKFLNLPVLVFNFQ